MCICLGDMIRIGIYEKNISVRNIVKEVCISFFQDKEEMVLVEYLSGNSLLADELPDILFLCLDAEPWDGLFIKDILLQLRAETWIIFINKNEEGMANAFDRNVCGFLKYSAEKEQWMDILERTYRYLREEREVIYCKKGNEIKKIYYKEILWVKAYGRYSKLQLSGKRGEVFCDRCISEWCLEGSAFGFLQCHRSYVVNTEYIEKWGKTWCQVGGRRVPISKTVVENVFGENFSWKEDSEKEMVVV